MNSDGLTKPPNKRKLDLVKSRVQTAISGMQTEHIIKRRQMEHGSKYLLYIAQARKLSSNLMARPYIRPILEVILGLIWLHLKIN